jgi:hypothetical protein
MNTLISHDIAIAVVFAITGWMLRTWLSHRERMKGLSMSKQGLASSDQRLARVEQAVESIAIEVERISEGQRYVTKLMSDRAQPVPLLEGVALPVQARRMDTPH